MQTSERILQSVAEIILSKGYENVTMTKVAKQCGIAKSTLYEHYDSKDEMVARALMMMIHESFDRFYEENALDGNKGFEVVMRALIRKMTTLFSQTLLGSKVLMEDHQSFIREATIREDLRKNLQKNMVRYQQYIKELLHQGQREGLIREPLTDLDIAVTRRFLVVNCTLVNQKDCPDFVNTIEDDEVEDYVYDNMMRFIAVGGKK